MSAFLCYEEQAFLVTNATKDFLYEIVLEMANRDNPAVHQRLQEDGRLIGCYGVSGLGVDLEAFVECFGGKENFEKTVLGHLGVIDEMCSHEAKCVRHMEKLFTWIWFLLDGGRCNEPSGKHPCLEDLAEIPG